MVTPSFLGLPTELRILIDKSIFLGREVKVILTGTQVILRHSKCQILQVSKKIGQEAEPILHRMTLYIFTSPDALTKMAHRLPLAFFYYLSHVKLDIWFPSHQHINYSGFYHLTLCQGATTLRLLYLRRGRTLKELIVVMSGPTYPADDFLPFQPRRIHPWRFEYDAIRDAIKESIRAEHAVITDDITRMDSSLMGGDHYLFFRHLHTLFSSFISNTFVYIFCRCRQANNELDLERGLISSRLHYNSVLAVIVIETILCTVTQCDVSENELQNLMIP